ncbi:lysine transporter LysE [Izhakiella australiensis]|uniref:Lysine transporter LysE n=1 Tax=Izhakiella australiensis TaxID=1926881 RepID=A0A1S8YL39_9GAMM|nr:lysine transporter LysE [Izhakiella australiensis]
MTGEFLITSCIVVISPGSGALYTIATGLTHGVKNSIIAAVGCTLGIIPHIAAAITGLAAIFHSSTLAFSLIKWAGAAWLLYMAWRTLRESGALQLTRPDHRRTPGRTIAHAVLINLLNPKLSLFFLAFLPQFISSHAATPLRDMLILSGIFMLITLLVFIFYGAFAALVRDYVLSRPAVITGLRCCFAGGFTALAVRLIFTQRA